MVTGACFVCEEVEGAIDLEPCKPLLSSTIPGGPIDYVPYCRPRIQVLRTPPLMAPASCSDENQKGPFGCWHPKGFRNHESITELGEPQ